MSEAIPGIANADVVLRLIVAAVLGGIVGVERERVEQPAGLRDHALVALGSALLMIVSAYGFRHVTHAPNVVLDPSRMAAQVVSGIGFIGAGTIIFRRNVVRGLTTAASVWIAAAIGLACGGALYFPAIVATVIVLIILAALRPLQRKLARRLRRQVVAVSIVPHALALADIEQLASRSGVILERLDLRGSDGNTERIELVIARPRAAAVQALVDALRTSPHVRSVKTTIEALRGLGQEESVEHDTGQE